jgi:hypothetical protein
MKMRFEFPEDSASASPQRGAAPVGLLQELPAVDLAAIVYLRAWCAGGSARLIIAEDFRLVMGEEAGAAAARDFDALMSSFLSNARRPVMRHGMGCKCFGGDESVFARLVASAAVRDRDDAALFASTLIDGHAVYSVVYLAEQLGQAFLHLARGAPKVKAPTHASPAIPYKH